MDSSNSQPFVSTFEGPGSSDDWIDIKSSTNCFFVPDWSSRGTKAALQLSGGVADALFSWGAWPWGNDLVIRMLTLAIGNTWTASHT